VGEGPWGGGGWGPAGGGGGGGPGGGGGGGGRVEVETCEDGFVVFQQEVREGKDTAAVEEGEVVGREEDVVV